MRATALLLPLLPTAVLLSQQEPAVQPERTLVDFARPGEAARWRTVLDGVMGGRSTGSFVVEEGAMRFTGVLNTNGGGFSSVRRPGKDLRLGQDGEVGVRLRVRADGRKYTLRLRQPTERRRFAASYRTQFQTEKGDGWQDVYVPYSALRPTWRGRNLDLPPVDPTKVDELGLSIDDKIDGPFRIEIQQFATYGAFDLAALRGDRRPLVVFARDAGDEKLKQQLAAYRDAARGFDERDVTLVVVYEEGASFAGDRPLSARDCEALRDRFRRNRRGAEDGFAALLVGKDGGVKRTSYEPLDTGDLFGQIDQMPMRRREVRERRR
ncbi:MAG: CIA30 family protein [Planctomycetota bacterium]